MIEYIFLCLKNMKSYKEIKTLKNIHSISEIEPQIRAVLKSSKNFRPSVRRPPSDNALHRRTPL